jgi:hypothetical protein
MVWGCMGYAGVGELAIVEGIMNTKDMWTYCGVT